MAGAAEPEGRGTHKQLAAEWQRIEKSRDPFSVLGMAPTATSSQARAAFLQGTRLFPPRRFGADAAAPRLAPLRVQARKRAYDRLIDDARCDQERARLSHATTATSSGER